VVTDPLQFFHFYDLISPEEEEFRKKVREFCETEVRPVIDELVEKAEFPTALV
jgi:glutaryl-CoA dehydrogenase